MGYHRFLSALVLAFGLVGYLARSSSVEAAATAPPAGVIPNACPQWECKEVSYYWAGGKKAHGIVTPGLPGAGGGQLYTTAFEEIYATTSTWNKPSRHKNKERYDDVDYAACVPTCGMDNKGVWQILQEASPVGNSVQGKQGNLRYTCPHVANGVGNAVANPKNINPKNSQPPGYVTP